MTTTTTKMAMTKDENIKPGGGGGGAKCSTVLLDLGIGGGVLSLASGGGHIGRCFSAQFVIYYIVVIHE